MTSIAAVLAISGEKQSAAVLNRLAANPVIGSIAVATSPNTTIASNKVHRLRLSSLRSAAAAVEVLRWFDTTQSSHLLWMLSPRVELTPNSLQRLTHVANDTRAAILYSDYFDQQLDGSVTVHPLVDYQIG